MPGTSVSRGIPCVAPVFQMGGGLSKRSGCAAGASGPEVPEATRGAAPVRRKPPVRFREGLRHAPGLAASDTE